MSVRVTEGSPGAAIGVLGLVFCILARQLPQKTGFGLGPAFLPFWTGVLLLLCGVWLMIRPGERSEAQAVPGAGLRRAAAGFLILLLYALALEPFSLGVICSSTRFLMFAPCRSRSQAAWCFF